MWKQILSSFNVNAGESVFVSDGLGNARWCVSVQMSSKEMCLLVFRSRGNQNKPGTFWLDDASHGGTETLGEIGESQLK